LKRIAIFASGAGSNAKNIIQYFGTNPEVTVVAVLTNNPNAKVLDAAAELGVATLVFSREEFYKTHKINQFLGDQHVDLIVLAGFLWLVPQHLVHDYPRRIINIHPALLPKFGGKGMFGNHVHEAVKASGAEESGITIHFVNEKYDEGDILFQTTCKVSNEDTPETIAAKVHQLEYEYYPKVIEQLLLLQNA
jgi:phosphoribosylglycinamide formyltransferase-1